MPEEQPKDKPVEKTREQLEAERLKRYQEKPGNFIEISEIIVASLRAPQGIGTLIGEASRTELEVAQSKLNHVISKVYMRLDMDAQMKNDAAKQILKPGGGNGKHRIVDFIRGKN